MTSRNEVLSIDLDVNSEEYVESADLQEYSSHDDSPLRGEVVFRGDASGKRFNLFTGTNAVGEGFEASISATLLVAASCFISIKVCL
jgi:hypothetical protein